jgi:hypothetical protein
MPSMRRPSLFALMLGLALLGAVVAPQNAVAHSGILEDAAVEVAPATSIAAPALENRVWSAAPATAAVPWPLLAAVVAVAALGARRPRRALALTLIVLAAVFAFESGVHSVHHLADRDGAQQCAVAAASQHVAGTEVDAVAADAVPAASPLLAAPGSLLARARFIGPDQDRAPPALLA